MHRFFANLTNVNKQFVSSINIFFPRYRFLDREKIIFSLSYYANLLFCLIYLFLVNRILEVHMD